MSLSSVKNGSNISGVSGRMLFEWADVCDGWAVQQHLKLRFTYAEGDDSNVTSTEITWESKDSKRYNFNIRRVNDGKETDRFIGKAELNDDGGEVVYSVPTAKTLKLSPETLFPSAHTNLILDKASKGDKIFTRRVFDGTDEEGFSDVSVFINSATPVRDEMEISPKLKTNALLAQSSLPVRLAFYKPDTETGEPDYEMNLNLLANGIAKTMRIDYGDFSVSGILSDVEPLPAPHCQ